MRTDSARIRSRPRRSNIAASSPGDIRSMLSTGSKSRRADSGWWATRYPPGASARTARSAARSGSRSVCSTAQTSTSACSPRRIAFGTLARLAGEAIGKVASLAFFVVIARELGEEQFGDFIFAMSLSTVFLIVAGLGLQEMVGRELAKDPRRADALVWNVIAIRTLTLVALLLVMTGVVAAQGRSLEIAVTILIVSLGMGFEDQAGTL